jgi:glutathione S-transferase
MIELIQFPWSPYCLVQGRILEFASVRFKAVNIPPNDRSLVWRLTRERYYQLPVLKDGRTIVFETGEDSQVIAKYLDDRYQLGLFPRRLEGVQALLWHHIEADVEGYTFRLNDARWREFVPKVDRLAYLRHKERKFGRGCLEAWGRQKQELLTGLRRALQPYEDMLMAHPFLLEERPRFVDFDLYGMLRNFLYSGRYALPKSHPRLRDWYARMGRI